MIKLNKKYSLNQLDFSKIILINSSSNLFLVFIFNWKIKYLQINIRWNIWIPLTIDNQKKCKYRY